MTLFSGGQKPPEGGAAAVAVPATEEPSRPRHTIGALLRETRENYGGDIDRIANALRIRAPYLTALEEGHYDRLPAPVYALGFVRAYAIHLGLDGEEAVRRFKQEASGFEIPRDLVFPAPLGERSIPRRPILIAAVLLALLAYGAWYYISSSSRARPERVGEVPASLLAQTGMVPKPAPPAAAPPIAAQLPAPASALAPPVAAPAAAPTPTPAPPPVVANSAPPPAPPTLHPLGGAAVPASSTTPEPDELAATTPPAAPPAVAGAAPSNHVYGVVDAPVHVVIRAKTDSWLQVRDAGQSVVFQRLMKAGDLYRVPDRPGLSLSTGNAEALEILVDNGPIPPLSGTVRHDIRLDPERLKAGTAAPE
jgi:cytoskeleton protein RodZ